MANHIRQQIREAIATAVTGLATTGARVYQSRVYPLETANLPALLVYSDSDTSEPMTIHAPRVLQRSLSVRVVAIAKAVADVDDTLDKICKEVETALANPVSGLTMAKTVTLTGTQLEMVGTAEQPAGAANMQYQIDYFNAENAPDVAL